MSVAADYRWLTPPAPAAIAVVRCRAAPARLAALADRALPAPGRGRVARLVDARGGMVDEAVLVRLADDTLEAMVHGGPGIRAAVEAALGAHGFAVADGVDDADAWSALAAASSPAALRWLLAEPDRTPPFRAEFLRRAPVVLITGPANAGKSTLLNAWCGRQRALVSDVAGTTRDLVAAETLVEGWRLRLVDSAGLRASDDPLERAGQELVERARAWADLVLHLEPPGGGPGARPGDLVVLGKADLRPRTEGLRWSSVGTEDAEPARLLDRLGAAVLDRLGLAAPR